MNQSPPQVSSQLRELEEALKENYAQLRNKSELLFALTEQIDASPEEFGSLSWAPSELGGALFETCIVTLSRMWDKPSDDRLSLQTLFKKKSEIIEIAQQKPSVCVGFQQVRNSFEPSRVSGSDAASQLFDGLQSTQTSNELNNLVNYRDNFVGHALNTTSRATSTPYLPYRDFKKLIEKTKFCLVRFEGIINENPLLWEIFEADAKEAREFWKRIYDLQRESIMRLANSGPSH